MNVAGGSSLPSLSSSGSYDVVNDETVGDSFPAQASPRLGAILSKYGASLREGAFEPGMNISIMDLGFDVDDSFFTIRGKSIIRDAERASMEAMSDAAQVSALNKVMDPSLPALVRMGALGMMHAPVEPAAFKVPKHDSTDPKYLRFTRDPREYFVHVKTQESFSSPGSGMGMEATGREDSADTALALMEDPQRIIALPGYESIPNANARPGALSMGSVLCCCFLCSHYRGPQGHRCPALLGRGKVCHVLALLGIRLESAGACRVPMPWALGLISLSGAEWWSALEAKWENEFLFPGLNGADILLLVRVSFKKIKNPCLYGLWL